MGEEINTEKTAEEVRGVPFKKGDDPRRNTDGRPKGTKNFTTKVREALEKVAEGRDYTYEEAFLKAILKKAIVDQDTTIMRLIWNYLDGMPMQKIEASIDEKIQEIKVDIIQPNATKPKIDKDNDRDPVEQGEDNN